MAIGTDLHLIVWITPENQSCSTIATLLAKSETTSFAIDFVLAHPTGKGDAASCTVGRGQCRCFFATEHVTVGVPMFIPSGRTVIHVKLLV